VIAVISTFGHWLKDMSGPASACRKKIGALKTKAAKAPSKSKAVKKASPRRPRHLEPLSGTSTSRS
jgi:hypothetical protein